MATIVSSPLHADDLFEIRVQPSQHMQMGVPLRTSRDDAMAMAMQPCAWSVRHEGRLIACFGIVETFAGVQGQGWCWLAADLGAAHLPLTRFMRRTLEASPLARVDLIAVASDAEGILTAFGQMDPGMLLAAVMATPTRECTWARLLGFTPAAVLRKWGAASETHVLFERVR